MDFEDELTVFGDFVKGTCELMCPENERKIRERERLLHPLERQTISTLQSNDRSCPVQGVKQSKQYQNHIADPLRTIKAFSRSAAGHKMPQPADLRPFPVLDMTVTYLIENIACSDIEIKGWVDRYNFVTDRLRAVRQDMVIQSLPPNECVKLLVPMVKFHVFAGYWLSENPVSVFDPKMNNSFLQECIKRVLVMYDALRKTDAALTKTPTNFNDGLRENSDTCNSSEHLMGALYLLINLSNSQALNHGILRIVNTSKNCKSCPQKKAYEISLASLLGNYVRVCHLTKKMSPILCMAIAPHLPVIRRHALMVMSTAYSNKSSKFPLVVLRDILLWNNEQEVVNECRYYGLAMETAQDSNPQITFQKGIFNQYVKMAQPMRLSWVDERVRSSSVLQILGKH